MNEKADSSTIGMLLMVALTIILAAVIASAMFQNFGVGETKEEKIALIVESNREIKFPYHVIYFEGEMLYFPMQIYDNLFYQYNLTEGDTIRYTLDEYTITKILQVNGVDV